MRNTTESQQQPGRGASLMTVAKIALAILVVVAVLKVISVAITVITWIAVAVVVGGGAWLVWRILLKPDHD